MCLKEYSSLHIGNVLPLPFTQTTTFGTGAYNFIWTSGLH